MTNTRTIARNSGWFGLETVIGVVVGLFTTILIARYLGPQKNGYLITVSYLVTVVSNLGGMGIPATTRKYMAEFIGMGDRGTARFIYYRTLLLQVGLASLSTAGLLFWVLRDAPVDYRLASSLIALSMWPAMVNFVSSQANAATEDLSANLPASVLSTFVYFIAVAITVVMKWGVIGVGASLLCMRAVDFLVRFFPTLKRIRSWETTNVIPPDLRKRMLSFAWQSVASMVVALIVWDRCEVLLLYKLCPDIRQVSFYSAAFTMAKQLLLGATIFGTAVGTTIFAQYGRDRSRLPDITASSFRYLAMTSIPLHSISTALAVPMLLLLFTNQYADASMVVMIAPLLCLPAAFVGPVQSLLQSVERQSYIIAATVFAGFVDIGVAWYLIPAHGAVGACIGSGVAQLTAVGLMWAAGIYLYKVRLPWLLLAKIIFASALAALTAHYISARLPLLWGILLGGSASLVVLLVLFYLMHVLEPEDRARFGTLTRMLPEAMATSANFVLDLVFPQE